MNDDVRLESLGYAQELARRMSGFSNLAISLSIICILAGGVTSFHQGLCSVGGAAYGIAWPVSCLLSLVVALTMGHIASAFPTAGGLYHWAAILGGRGWGWITAWFNLAGLIAVLAAINLGTFLFVADVFGFQGFQLPGMIAITASQAWINHRGIRLTTRLTDFSGYWILFVTILLTAAVLAYAPEWRFERLVTFTNFSGDAGGGVWPRHESLFGLFLLSFLLPAYTVTGFDASAHTAEETVSAQWNVPKGIWRSVALSAIAGWILLCAVIVSAGDLDLAASKGTSAFFTIVNGLLPSSLGTPIYVGIAVAMYLCGLATVTSASRMTYAFARDHGLPFSAKLKKVSRLYQTPSNSIWAVAGTAIGFTIYTPMYETIAACSAIFLYLSYTIPIALGVWAYGRTWTKMGPWSLGAWFRPLGAVSVAFGLLILGVGSRPPNDKTVGILFGCLAGLAAFWALKEKRRFTGPPRELMTSLR